MLVETTDYQRVAKTIASEIITAENAGTIIKGSVPPPAPGIIELCGKKGDFYLVDTVELRIVGWDHPLSATEVMVLHYWGPSSYGGFATPWRGLVAAGIDFLISKGFTTMTWSPGNALATAGATLTQATQNANGSVSVNLLLAKTRIAKVQ